MLEMSAKISIIFMLCFISSINSQKSNDECILPEHPPNGERSIINKNNYVPNTSVPTATAIKITCNSGYFSKNFQLNGISYCINGKWIGDINGNLCQKSCPLLLNYEETMDIKCSLNSTKIDCSESVEGTKLEKKCKPFFDSKSRRSSTCSNGQWVPEVQPCNLECGIPPINPQVLVIEGVLKEPKEFPWVVRITKDDKIVCLGSLISRKHILSAAHCFTNLETGDVLDMKDYKIVTGEIENKQIRNIEKVIIHNDYRGRQRNYFNDIAVVVIKDFVINLSTQSVCLNSNENSLTQNDQGISFGLERNRKDEKLSKLVMTFEDKSSCKEKSPKDFYQVYYSADKICASYLEKRICGLGGAGFYVKIDGTYYVNGILSLAPVNNISFECDAKLPSLLTNISFHYKWLEEIIKVN